MSDFLHPDPTSVGITRQKNREATSASQNYFLRTVVLRLGREDKKDITSSSDHRGDDPR